MRGLDGLNPTPEKIEQVHGDGILLMNGFDALLQFVVQLILWWMATLPEVPIIFGETAALNQ